MRNNLIGPISIDRTLHQWEYHGISSNHLQDYNEKQFVNLNHIVFQQDNASLHENTCYVNGAYPKDNIYVTPVQDVHDLRQCTINATCILV